MEEFYIGKGQEGLYDDYVDFINYVFGNNMMEGRTDFPGFLPKIYKKERKPECDSYFVLENGKIKAVVGAFANEIEVCGIKLRNVGIGNVAVHPYARSKGYMKKLMHMAVDEMVEEKADLSVLGGLRQRYNYYSYEKANVCYSYQVSSTNIRHVFGDMDVTLAMEEVTSEDTQALDAIAAIGKEFPYVSLREREKLYDILRTWSAAAYVFKREEKIIGYCVVQEHGEVSEILVEKDIDFIEAVRAIVRKRGTIQIVLPEYLPAYMDALEPVAESVVVKTSEMFSVLCYKKVLEAFLKLKGTYTELPDGRITAWIHGRGGEEKLEVAVENGTVTVEETEEEPEYEFSHLEAMRFFFAPVCGQRRGGSEFVNLCFPLPLWLYSSDGV